MLKDSHPELVRYLQIFLALQSSRLRRPGTQLSVAAGNMGARWKLRGVEVHFQPGAQIWRNGFKPSEVLDEGFAKQQTSVRL